MFLLLCPFVATFFYPEYEEYMKNFYDICVKDRIPKSFEEIILCYFWFCLLFALNLHKSIGATAQRL